MERFSNKPSIRGEEILRLLSYENLDEYLAKWKLTISGANQYVRMLKLFKDYAIYESEILKIEQGLNLIESISGVEALYVTDEKQLYATSGFLDYFQLTDDTFTLVQ